MNKQGFNTNQIWFFNRDIERIDSLLFKLAFNIRWHGIML